MKRMLLGLSCRVACLAALSSASAAVFGQAQSTPPPPPPKHPGPPPAKRPATPPANAAAPAARPAPAPQPANHGATPGVHSAAVGHSVQLAPAQAAQEIKAINGVLPQGRGSARVTLPPNASVAVNPDHSYSVDTGDKRLRIRPTGPVASIVKGNERAMFDSHGKVQALHTSNLVVNRVGIGEHRVESMQGTNRVVSFGPHNAYVERPLNFGSQRLLQRTYLRNGVTSTHVYRSYQYQNGPMANYIPATYYSPAFYSWIETPWRSPVSFSWSWNGGPWATANNSYFSPAPSYSSPSLWMTDHMMAATLSSGYDQKQDLAGTGLPEALDEVPLLQSSADAPVTPQIKQAIAQQVSHVVAEDAADSTRASGSASPPGGTTAADVPAPFDSKIKLYIVASSLQVLTTNQQQCGLVQGDLIFLPAPPANGVAEGDLIVESSHRGGCPVDTHVVVSIHDLNEMNNHFRENLGLAEEALAEFDKKGNLPAPPNPDPRPSSEQNAAIKDVLPVQTDLDQQSALVQQTETTIKQDALVPSGTNNR